MKTPDVSIIVVNYKTSALFKNAFESIRDNSSGFSFEIIVVDNSQDENELNSLLRYQSDGVCVIDAKSNLGFGKANNLGAAIAKGRYLYFLNVDTLLKNNAILPLKDYLDAHLDVGVVGSNLYTKSGDPNHSYVPFEKNIRGEKKLNSVITSVKNKIRKERIDFNYSDSPLEIKGYVCGASLMIRKDVFDRLGGFDKDIFMYAEESLLCYRVIHETSMRVFNIPSSKVVHLEGGSFQGMTYSHAKMIANGNYVYYLKAYGENYATKAMKYFKKFYFSKFLEHCFVNRSKKETYYHLSKAFEDKLEEITSKTIIE